MYFMNVQTLELAQQGDIDCIQQVFNHCNRFLKQPNGIFKSLRFQSTMRFHTDLTVEDVCHDILIDSVEKVISFFNKKLTGNNVEAFIIKAINFCANDWLNHKNKQALNPYIMVNGEKKLFKHLSVNEISDSIDECKGGEFVGFFEENSWNPEQISIYNDYRNQIVKLVEEYIYTVRAGSIFISNADIFVEASRLILQGNSKEDISEELDLRIHDLYRLHYDIINPVLLVAMDDKAVYERYLPKLHKTAHRVIKRKKGVAFMESYGL